MGAKSGSGKTLVTDYLMSLHYGWCYGPVDAVLKLIVADKEVVFEADSNTFVDITKPDLFGGPKKGGGLAGRVYAYLGGDTQVMDVAVASRYGAAATDMPGYRGIFSLFFSAVASTGGFLWGANTPYVPATKATIRRRPKTFTDDTMIGNDANPAHMIYELLVNPIFGSGISPTLIDENSYAVAGQILKAEGLGLSMTWFRSSSVEKMIADIESHISANNVFNRVTGKYELKLIRDDYDLDSLRSINPTCAEITDYTSQAWGNTINEIQVEWTNPVNEQKETVTVHNDANIAIQGEPVSTSKQYHGARRQSLAVRLGMRDLMQASAPLRQFSFAADRRFWNVNRGDVLRIDFPLRNLDGVPGRVLDVDLGDASSSTVMLKMIEDIFATPGYRESLQVSLWNDPSLEPVPLPVAFIHTAPYFLVAGVLGDAEAETFQYPVAFAMLLAPVHQRDLRQIDYLESSPTAPATFADGGTLLAQSSATLASALSFEVESALTVSGMEGPSVPVGSLAVITNAAGDVFELVHVDSLAPITVSRGVLDTIPQTWAVGSKIIFLPSDEAILDQTQRMVASTAAYKFLPITSIGRLEASLASTVSTLLTDRMHRPLRPANVRVNGALGASFTIAPSTSTITVSWANRNRKTETNTVLRWDDATVVPEPDQLTRIEVLNETGTVITILSDLTGESYNMTRTEFGVTSSPALRSIRVMSTRNGYTSLQNIQAAVAFL